MVADAIHRKRSKRLAQIPADGAVLATLAARPQTARTMEPTRRKRAQGRKAAGILSDKRSHRGLLTTATAIVISNRAPEGSEITALLAIAHLRNVTTHRQRSIIVPHQRHITVRPRNTSARRQFTAAVGVVDVLPAVEAVPAVVVAADTLRAEVAGTAANDLPSAAPAHLTGLERHFFVYLNGSSADGP